MSQPKFSEVLRAAANGCMTPYGQGQQAYGNAYLSSGDMGQSQGRMGPTYNTSDYQRAREMAGMLHAIADVYARYEQAEQAQTPDNWELNERRIHEKQGALKRE